MKVRSISVWLVLGVLLISCTSQSSAPAITASSEPDPAAPIAEATNTVTSEATPTKRTVIDTPTLSPTPTSKPDAHLTVNCLKVADAPPANTLLQGTVVMSRDFESEGGSIIGALLLDLATGAQVPLGKSGEHVLEVAV